MPLTHYHAKYLAHDLTLRHPPGSTERVAAVMARAQVDLNPHQVEAAISASSSRTSIQTNAKGRALLKALEVGFRTKRAAAEQWCRHATGYSVAHRGKPWRYGLIAHDVIADNMSVGALIRSQAAAGPLDSSPTPA